MKATPTEKMETIRLVEGSSLGVKRTLAELCCRLGRGWERTPRRFAAPVLTLDPEATFAFR